MAGTFKKLTYTIAAALVAALCFLILCESGGAHYASAALSSPQATYEAQNVWNDLQSATYDGESIDLNLYNFDSKKNVQIISFVEFCYSPFTTKQDDFGLYVYVYNPRGLDWTEKPAENKIQFRYTGKTTTNFDKYPLQFLNKSEAAGYEGLFYKFKIVLSDTERTAILSTVNSSARVYEVSGIELCDSNNINATDYNISNIYTYTGYAKGYGADGTDTDTLSCTSDGLATLTLDVHPTFYRPDGSNGKDQYTQDSLQSVYFSIPNDILNEYGGLSAVHATWLNAVTSPFLVTGNKTIYQQLENYVGRDIGNTGRNKNVGYGIYGAYTTQGNSVLGDTYVYASIAYNPWQTVNDARLLPQLNGLFYADSGNADNYKVSSENLLEWFIDFSERFGSTTDGLILDKYSPALFDNVDEKFTDMNIQADDKYSLTSEKISQDWWQKIFGGSYVSSHKTFDNIEAIHKVTDEDFKSGNTELICDNLYINNGDYLKFKAFYDLANVADKTVFLLRYQVSDYKAWEATEREYYERSTILIGDKTDERTVDTNAYFFQETANLDFDIIDVTCNKGDIKTVIACISSPQDIVNPSTPPINTTTETWLDKILLWLSRLLSNLPWWGWVILIAIVLGIVVGILSIFFPALRGIFKVIWWFISAPFRGIAALVKRGRECRERKRAEREKQEQTNNAQKKAKKPRKGKKKKNNNRRNN